MKQFIVDFEARAVDSASPIGSTVVEEAIEKLLKNVVEYEDDFHVLTTRGDGLSCADTKAPVSIPLQVRLWFYHSTMDFA